MLLAILLAAVWAKPTPVETSLFIAAEALIAVDTLQSLDIKNHRDMYETNPLMGRHPSDARYLATWAVVGAAVAAGWWFLPSPWRDAVTIPVITVEVPNTIRNAYVGLVIRL